MEFLPNFLMALCLYILISKLSSYIKKRKEVKEKPEAIIPSVITNRKTYPYTLNEYIGHEKIIQHLKLITHNNVKHNVPLGHILFYGIGGLGKTTLSEIVADTLNKPLITAIGEQVKTPDDVERLVLSVPKNGMLFLDEVHMLKPYETFYSVMQDKKLFLKSGHVHDLIWFTLIAATTLPDKLDKPFFQRFNYVFHLEPYSTGDITRIIMNCYKDEYIDDITKDAAHMIAKMSQGVVRIGRNEMLRAVKDFAIYNENRTIDMSHVQKVIEEKEIDKETGLSKLQMQTLKILSNHEHAIGSKNLSEVLQVSRDFFTDSIEPTLVINNFIQRTPKGRLITPKGESVINR